MGFGRGRRGIIGGAAEHVEQAAIERPRVLAAEPTEEPFGIFAFEVMTTYPTNAS